MEAENRSIMSGMKESGLVEKIMHVARAAGEIILHAERPDAKVSIKSGRANFVTVYDEKVQEYLIGKLSEILPEAHFVGEEEELESFAAGYDCGYTFVLDPIDGTTNFMKGYRLSVVSIGLFLDGRPYIGVVYNPYTDQMFGAEKGCGAWENGERIDSGDEPLSRSLVNMGTAPYYEEEITRSAFQIGHFYMRRSLDIRRTGSAAYDLCLVASGKIGLYYEPILSLWDYAAGAMILEEAGGKITDLRGETLAFRGKSSVCAVTRGVAAQPYLPPEELLR